MMMPNMRRQAPMAGKHIALSMVDEATALFLLVERRDDNARRCASAAQMPDGHDWGAQYRLSPAPFGFPRRRAHQARLLRRRALCSTSLLMLSRPIISVFRSCLHYETILPNRAHHLLTTCFDLLYSSSKSFYASRAFSLLRRISDFTNALCTALGRRCSRQHLFIRAFR